MAAEKNFEDRVKNFLQDEGIYEAGTPTQKMTVPICGWFFKVWGGGYQKAGIPDLIITCKGHFLGVELKAPNGHPSDLQKKNIRMIVDSGSIGIVLYPKDFDQFKDLIHDLKGGADIASVTFKG